MGLIVDGLSMLNTSLFASEGESVTYSRFGTSATLTVIFGSTAFEEETRAGAVLQTRSIDALAKTADVTAAGLVEPRPADRITRGALVYEVVAIGGGPCWTYSDTERSRMRIHLKQVAA